MTAPPIAQWRGELKSDDVATRAAAAEQLSQTGPDAADAAVELVEACGDDESVQQWAVAALEEMGPPSPEAASRLEPLVTDDHPLIGYWAATLLGRLGPAAADHQRGLAQGLQPSRDPAVRERSAWALGKIGVTDPEAIQALQAAAREDAPRLQKLANDALPSAATRPT